MLGRAMMLDGNDRSGRTAVDHVYRVTEIVGSSKDSIDQAIRNGAERAAQTLHNLDWFEVTARISNGMRDIGLGWLVDVG